MISRAGRHGVHPQLGCDLGERQPKYFLLHAKQRGMPAEEGSNEEEALDDLLRVIGPALTELCGAVALPSGAEVESDPDPDQLPAQRRYPRLRRVLFWPLA